ncbi:MOSC domain-containing protein [Acidiphilium iwatense]|uniref:MOSC domain-containing protein n=1 Tax=Acidiphilium iwatense TaxID=768198 RepID=A0ABS9DYV4_9PROT|nr:MOSC N-terminal beta barrel domain-containing protein [Acidiphilium iwatense]MCF3947926.1 MOSC domain-containing protein [Acidiphilium iwatense]
MRIDSIYRYPVKGLTPENLATAQLRPGRAIEWDRAFALAQGDCGFDESAAAWRSKTEFLCLARNPDAALLASRFDETAHLLTLTAPDGATIDASPFEPEGRTALAAFIATALPRAMRGTPRFVYAENHSFCDNKTQVVSLIGLPSLRALEEAAGAPRQPLRFRASLYLAGLDPWEEFTWLNRTIAIGGTKLRATARIARCAATCVNPETRRRDANPVKELMTNFGHVDCGIYATVIEGGPIAPGDAVRLLS